jgi:hypothetical protein
MGDFTFDFLETFNAKNRFSIARAAGLRIPVEAAIVIAAVPCGDGDDIGGIDWICQSNVAIALDQKVMVDLRSRIARAIVDTNLSSTFNIEESPVLEVEISSKEKEYGAIYIAIAVLDKHYVTSVTPDRELLEAIENEIERIITEEVGLVEAEERPMISHVFGCLVDPKITYNE